MERVAFIINPFSAKKEYEGFLEKLQEKIENPRYIISQTIEETKSFIKNNFHNTDIFVAMGGDGTISTVARKLINTEKILAVFPAGSGNGFANEIHFSKNLDELIYKLKNKKTRQIDTFIVNDKLSINVSGVGFDGEVARKFEDTSRGFSNYVKTILESFSDFKPIRIKFEGEYERYNGEYLMMSVANTRQFGNNAYIAPQADVTDGLVDMVLVKKFPLTYAMPFVFKMFAKTIRDDEYIQHFSASELSFSVDTDTWHIDGEYLPITSPVKVKVLPRSLNILE